MRTLLHLALAASFTAPVASAQLGQWRQAWPPVEPTLVDVVSTSALQAWIAAENGEVRHTTTGGVFWSTQQLALNEVTALAARGTWVCAVGNGIARSSDNGQTWTTLNAPGLKDVHLTSATHGWAVGDAGRVYRTTSGGASWVQSNIPGVTGTLRSVHFLDTQTGWVAGDNGRHLKTVDGGLNWQFVALPSGSHFTDVFYADAQRGWLAAGNFVLRTQNGGANWTSTPVGAGARADRLSVLGGNWLWSSGSTGAISTSSNAGAAWTQQFTTGGAPLLDISMGDLFAGFAVGVNGSVYRTSDGGAQWQLLTGGNNPNSDLVLDVTRRGAKAWASLSTNVVLRSEDDGANWTPVTAGLSGVSYTALDFFDELRGYAVGRRNGSIPTTAWTQDGGLTWNPTYWPGLYFFADVDALSANVAVACADNGLWRTTNGGLAWSFLQTTPLSGFFGADFIDASRGWAVGYDVMKTVDGGQTWTFAFTPASPLRAVSFADDQHGWAVGDDGVILATLNGGATWIPQSIAGGAPTLYTVEALSPNVVWITGADGFVARSTDGGANWTPEAPAGLGASASYGSSFAADDDGFITSFYPVAAIWKRSSALCSALPYCQAKVSSSGCTPSIQSSGAPSVSSPANFVITTANVERDKNGVMFFGLNGRTSAPYQGGVVCVAPPLFRLSPSNSGGSAVCQGALVYSLADLLGQPTAGPSLVAGALVHCQTWFRDPASTYAAGLSDALEVSLCP